MDTIWFLHAPRTGGRSISIYLRKNEGSYNFYFRGHEKFSINKYNELKTNLVLITALRCPVENTVSLYSVAKSSKNHEWYSSVVNKTFSQWIRSFSCIHNFYYNFYSIDDMNAFDVLKKCDYVFDTKNLTQHMNEFAKRYNLPEFNLHTNSYAKPIATLDDIEYIKKIRSKDYELLNTIRKG